MRRGELLGLKWNDIDFEAKSVSIRQSLVTIGYQVSKSAPKTARSSRTIIIDTHTLKVLRDHRKAQLEERLAAGTSYQDSDLVFATEDGGWIHPDGFSKAFKRHCRAAGVPAIRFHDLRHDRSPGRDQSPGCVRTIGTLHRRYDPGHI